MIITDNNSIYNTFYNTGIIVKLQLKLQKKHIKKYFNLICFNKRLLLVVKCYIKR